MQVRTKRITVTGTGGIRVRANATNPRTQLTVPWDYALDAHGNHEAAASALAKEPVYVVRGITGGYVWETAR